ncbi:hypothetical protein PHET_06876 [Paragonimus heterotremus]|uniref:Uncharacterized protein n=1 Tax=Paragonimus heterotremus TaxID=100268 RepID=A0A8J4SWG4_9TREM|nr:hypothetical protein PHET_06876 [Paragonimus heterotremus]
MNGFIFGFTARTKLNSVKTNMTVAVRFYLKQLCVQNFKEIKQDNLYKRDLMGAVSRLDTFTSICPQYKIEDLTIKGHACRTRWNEKLQAGPRTCLTQWFNLKSQITMFVSFLL